MRLHGAFLDPARTGVTDTRSQFDHLLWVYVPILIAVFAIVTLLLLLVVGSSFRRKETRHGRSARPLLELSYAALLAAVAISLITFSIRAEARVDRVRDDPGLTIAVTAFQWQWHFSYEDGVELVGTREKPATIEVPTDTTIEFTLTSRDVVHSFWIPEVRFKRDAFPERESRFDLDFANEGTFAGRCAEFCGLRHANMTFEVHAVSPAEFQAWLQTERGR
jgi:cytochrome c oxidase subunit 2